MLRATPRRRDRSKPIISAVVTQVIVSKEPGGRPVVLIVEDDEDLMEIFQRNFRRVSPKAELACATDGVSAIKYILDHGVPDLVITDLNMPHMNGYELLSWIRLDPSTERIPVVVYSSSQDPADVQRCSSLGASEFLTKQASTVALDALLDRFLEDFQIPHRT